MMNQKIHKIESLGLEVGSIISVKLEKFLTTAAQRDWRADNKTEQMTVNNYLRHTRNKKKYENLIK